MSVKSEDVKVTKVLPNAALDETYDAFRFRRLSYYSFSTSLMEVTDTDTSLAILSSLLEPATYPIEQLLEALTENDGDVTRAAESLLLPRIKSSGKRKAGASLESWLGKEQPTSPKKPRPEAPGLDPKPIDLLSVLKQPESRPKTQPQPAILLSTQKAIDKQHLPLTILDSPLSPEFASALYLAMMEESEQWGRHRWYLAGKWVESPHLMTTYTRQGGGYAEDEASRYYYSGAELDKPKVGSIS